MSYWNAGSKLHAADLVGHGVRYEGPNQALTIAGDHQVQFATAVTTDTIVAVSGTNNNQFQLNATGWWMISAGIAWGNTNSGVYFYLAVGTSTPGTQLGGFNYSIPTGSSNNTFGVLNISMPYFATSGDTIVVGASVTTTALTTQNDRRTFFSAALISRT